LHHILIAIPGIVGKKLIINNFYHLHVIVNKVSGFKRLVKELEFRRNIFRSKFPIVLMVIKFHKLILKFEKYNKMVLMMK
jgi:hypothetical protein